MIMISIIIILLVVIFYAIVLYKPSLNIMYDGYNHSLLLWYNKPNSNTNIRQYKILFTFP